MTESIYSYTPRRQLTWLERLSMASYVAHGHRFGLFSYEKVNDLPVGVAWYDAAEVLPALKSGARVSIRQFRWAALCRQGGIWVDPDMVALRPLVMPEDAWVCAFENINDIGTGLIKSSPNHPLAKAMWRKSRRPFCFALCHPEVWRDLRRRNCFYKWGETRDCLGEQLDGAPEFTRTVLRHCLSARALPPYHFYPVPRHRAGALFDKTYQQHMDSFPDSQSVCLYASERPYRDAAARPPSATDAGSFVGALVRRYL